MWPDYSTVEGSTERAEDALGTLYEILLHCWVPWQAQFMLPHIEGEVLEPNFEAIVSRQALAAWEGLVTDWVLPAFTAIWSWTYVQAMQAAGTPLLDPGLTAAGVNRPDLVADLVALAFETKPSQMKLAMLMVADDARNASRLQRFLGEHRQMADSLPGRIRDMLVGSAQTARKKKQALTVTEVRAQLGGWLRQQYDLKGVAKPHRNTHQLIAKQGTVDVGFMMGLPGSKPPEMVEIWEPQKVEGLELFKPFRDMAREAGLQAAGLLNQATLIAASQSDVEFDVVWIARMDERTRDTHFAADGQRRELGQDFRVGKVDLAYPGDPKGPPGEVINCRCRVGMVKVGDPMPHEQRRTKEQRAEINRRREAGIIRAREDPEGIGFITPVPDTQLTASAEADERTDMAEDIAQEIAAAEASGELFRTFTDAVLALIGVSTSDNRILAADIDLSFREFPLPLMWMRHTGSGEGGHTEAFTVGVIEDARIDEGRVLGSGYMLNTPEADEACQQISHKVTGPSVDLAAVEWQLTDGDGAEISEEQWWELPPDAQVYQTLRKAELIGTTLVPKPAFGATMLTLNADRESRDIAIVAGATERFQPRVYPARFFADPQLAGPTLTTMDDDGRIYGHLACFGACHRGIQSDCIMAPRSRSNYSHFHTSPAVRLDDGTRLPVGRLTVGCGHAPDHLAGGPAAAHYDNTGTCWALVRVGEDAHGIWFSGVVAPWATPEQIEMGLAAPLSGDWRDYGQGLELTAVLSVNTPGFAARGRDDADGRPVTLVASLGPAPSTTRGGTEGLTREDIKTAVVEALDAQKEAAAYQQRRTELLARAQAKVGTPPTPAERIRALLAARS